MENNDYLWTKNGEADPAYASAVRQWTLSNALLLYSRANTAPKAAQQPGEDSM